MLTYVDVAQAAARIAGRVRRTPVFHADHAGLPGPVWLKCEFMQHTGSFKARGAFARLLAAQERGLLDPATGVVAASGGNAGLAVAFAAGQVGVPVEVWVPTTAPEVKVDRLRALGATVVRHGGEYAEAYLGAVDRAAQRGAVYCHAYDDPDVAAGQGTVALELTEQITEDIDTVLVAVGGGGLMAGVAAALEGTARVVGVEPVQIPTLHAALEAGEPVDVPVSGIAADSLGARRIGGIAFALARRCNVHSVLVADNDIIAARRLLWQRQRIAVEHAAAAPLAALTTGAYEPQLGERVAVVLCGANTDPCDLTRVPDLK